MANFSTHLFGATLASGLGAAALSVLQLASPFEAVSYLGIGILGGILPDIDATQAIPTRIGFTALAILGTGTAASLLWDLHPLPIVFLICLVCFVLVRYPIFYLFATCTVHRGMVHSIPTAILLGLTLACVSFHYFSLPANVSWFAAAFLTLGFLVHLVLDELYSVDLFNVRIKRSFGTALKFGSKSNILITLILYVAIATLARYVPPYARFIQSVTNKKHIDRLQNKFNELVK